MGVMITIKYNERSIRHSHIESLSNGLKHLVEEVMNESDVFVYADAPAIAVGNEPLEVFVQVNGRSGADCNTILNSIADGLGEWKRQHNFSQTVNLNVIPVEWYFKAVV